MSARKPLALALVICGLTGTNVHADPISWPSGLNNWLIYLAAPKGTAGTGPVNYTVPSTPVVTPPAVTVPPIATASHCHCPPHPFPQRLRKRRHRRQLQPRLPFPPRPRRRNRPRSSHRHTFRPQRRHPLRLKYPRTLHPQRPQPSMVQAVTYIPPASSQPASVQPVMYTPPTGLSNGPLTANPPPVIAQSVPAVAPLWRRSGGRGRHFSCSGIHQCR